MFDGKGSEVDRNERAIEAAVADFREQLEAFEFPGEPAAGTLHRAASAAGTLLANVAGLLLLALLVGGFAAAARLGWELLG